MSYPRLTVKHRYSFEGLIKILDGYEAEFGAGSTHMFIVSPEINQAAVDMAKIEMEGVSTWGEVFVPVDAKRHGTVTLLAVEVPAGGYGIIHLGENNPDPPGHPHTIVALHSNIPGTENGIGSYIPGEHVKVARNFSSDEDIGNVLCDAILIISFIMSLINQPNITSVSPALSRQQRRAMARSGKPSSGSLSIVQWNIGEGAKARALAASGGKPRALHWRRGHWRRAEQHYHGAVQRSEGGWWQWIEGMWVGHPAFGVIKSIHAPQIAS
jgi:hypothetical protein